MRIGVPKESRPGETRVAATPKTVSQMVGLGYEVVVEAGAGARASFGDTAYQEAGAAVAGPDEVWPSDIILKVNAPGEEEIGRLRPGAILASLLAPALSPDLVERLTAQGVTALAMDAVPRISRAQSLDVLSSMANIGGYRAVVEAAHEFGQLLHRPGHRCGQGAPGEGPHRRSRRRGPGRDRDGQQPGRHRPRLRRPPRGRRAGRVDGGRVPAHRRRGRGAECHRLRQGDGRGLQPQGRRALRRAGQGRRHHHHDGADPGPARAAPDHRRHGGVDEAGLGHRRHGGRQRWQRRGHPSRRAAS